MSILDRVLEEIEPDDRFQVTGKQVKLDGEHFADARSDAAAAIIASALNNFGTDILPDAVRDLFDGFTA